ncbi:hypothetical protein [Pleionea litopenaei]|uniref:Uncharacterized protein n=1 Tax=Pleionea litopenaei TaxID=3070815 RepID=A0AA51RQP1_9GAMM|nr:hypothetical protein [Pleionea sp. HL-JVS1]WMS85768.1 hypothetical protein Q9312_11130 [Pleionea sp. HL-JVS1]
MMDNQAWASQANRAMVEDIVLESPQQAVDLLTPAPEVERHIEYELELVPKFSPFSYRFRLFDKSFIEVHRQHKSKGLGKSVAFHVGLLEAKPLKIKRTAWVTFIAAIATGIASGIMAFALADYFLAAGTGLFSLLLFSAYYFGYREVSLFQSRSGKAPLVILNHRCKDKKSLRNFITKLEDKIKTNTLPASSHFFAEETRWHRTLNEQGWLSDEEYQKARSRILKQFNRKAPK